MSDEDLDPEEVAMLDSLVGRTVRRVLRTGDPDSQGRDHAWLFLDDGRVVEFQGWGHDWWGLMVREVRTIDVDACRHCGLAHHDLQVFTQANGRDYAYCTDGNHRAWKSGPEGEEG